VVPRYDGDGYAREKLEMLHGTAGIICDQRMRARFSEYPDGDRISHSTSEGHDLTIKQNKGKMFSVSQKPVDWQLSLERCTTGRQRGLAPARPTILSGA
jgi:hypothetical protein